MYNINYTDEDAVYSEMCTGDAVRGDVIKFDEAIWGGTHRSAKFAGIRTITATIINDSYGATKQQHTFTLSVIDCTEKMSKSVGMSNNPKPSPEAGDIIKRKGRNVYKMGTFRKPWANEDERLVVQQEKHDRGDVARAKRTVRRNRGMMGLAIA